MIALLLCGFFAVACGTWRQSRLILGARPGRRVRIAMLAIGYGLIAAGLVAALARPDPARDVVLWIGAMTLAALAVVGLCWARDPGDPGDR